MSWPIDPAVLPAFLGAMVLVELTPGPNMGYLAALSAERGRAAGFAAVLGVQLGLLAYLLATLLGLTELMLVWPAAYEALRWAGVAYLLWLAWDAWRGAEAGPDAHVLPPASMARLVWRGFLANVLNPKAALFYVTLLPAFIRPGFAPTGWQIALFGSGHLAVSAAVHGLIVLGAARAGTLASRAAGSVRLRRTMAVGIALIAAWLAWSTRR